LIRLPGSLSVEDAVVLLQGRPHVLWAEPDYLLPDLPGTLALDWPNDPHFPSQCIILILILRG